MSEKTKELVVQRTKTELEMAISETTIKNLIYVIRGQQVMLDSDLAMLYHVETFNLNKAMKLQNKHRSKADFTGCAEMRIYVIISKNPREWAGIK